jgi:hypothetical protein
VKEFAGPERTREVPLQVAPGERVRKIEESDVYFGQKTTEAFEKLKGMGVDPSEDCAGQKREEPDETRGAIGDPNLSEQVSPKCWTDARERKMWSTPGKVGKGAALHADESEFAGGMHDFQNKFAGVGGNQMEVVVILTGEETRIGFNAVEGARQARGFGRGDGRSNPGLWHAHGEIVSRERVGRQIRGAVRLQLKTSSKGWDSLRRKRCVLRMTGAST